MVDLRRFIDFVRTRQPQANVELKLKRLVAKAELGEHKGHVDSFRVGRPPHVSVYRLTLGASWCGAAGVDVDGLFAAQLSSSSETAELSADGFRGALDSFGRLSSVLRPAEVDKLIRRLDTKGGGTSVGLGALGKLLGRPDDWPHTLAAKGGKAKGTGYHTCRPSSSYTLCACA